jgi:outer membrane protein OmpA-like peptidoglycan-associated protein
MEALPIDLHPSTEWAIASVSSKGFLGMDESIFDLVNVHTVRAHRLRVLSGSLGKGFTIVQFSPRSSMSNYSYFTTRKPVNFDDFDGVGARLFGGSALLYSWCSLTLWAGPAYTSPGLAWARMSGWGAAIPNIGVDHGWARVIYGDGEPLGIPETYPEIDIPPTPEELDTRFTMVSRDDSLVIVLDGDVLFDFDKAEVKREAERPLTQSAAILKSSLRSGSEVVINGFTDSVGTDDYNLALSERRAKAVGQWYTLHKYFSDIPVRLRGFGKSNPRSSNASESGRAKNRRVEVFVLNR